MSAQLGIAIFGVLAIWLSQYQSYEARKWACIAGFVSLPFGYWAAIHADQWGVMALNIACTVAWARGFRTYWMAKGAG